ncbi:MAG: DUF4097 family beta strand repeat-containing protein [Planctomycetota bacterium]|jgi:DUF4097 and DUF4098 domain-containing protein YvlB
MKGPQVNNLAKSLSLVTLLNLLAASCANKSIRVGGGGTRNGPLATVNGRITIGNECTVTGESRTVNGSITVGDNCEVAELRTVNGSIRIGSNTSVNGDAGTINGSIRCNSGSQVDGTLSTINGAITLTEAAVTGNLVTFNGNITLERGSRVQGDIVLRSRWNNDPSPKQPLIIKLSDGSVVEGDIINEDDRFEVHVILADDSKVLGEIKNAEIR